MAAQMPRFQITGPDGATYELDAPDENAAYAAYQQFTKGSTAQPQYKGGLIRDANGLRDPQTGQLVVALSPGASDDQYRVPAEQQNNGWNGWLQAGSSALLGAGDKLMAEIQSLKPGAPADAYDQALAHYRQGEGNYAEANPGTNLAATVAGGAIPAVGLGAAVSPILGEGLVGNAGVGAILGGTGGALNTDGSASDKLKAAALQAGIGGALGAAAVPVGQAIGSAAGSATKKITDAVFARNGAGLTNDAADALNGALASQGQTPEQALQATRDLGPGATLADAGQATRDLTARLAAREPAVAPTISDNLTQRAQQLTPRINNAVDNVLGPDFDATAKLAGLKVATRMNGRAAYEPVMNSDATVDVTPVRDMIAQTRVDPIAAGVEEDPISAALGKAQKLFVGSNPEALPIKVAHQAQAAIGDQADAALRAGNMAQARALTEVRNALLDQMPDAYNAARAQYATDKGIEDAFTEGRNVLAGKTEGQVFDPDLLRARLAGMSQPEQDAYRMGARKAVTDVMGQARSDPAALQTKLANESGYAANKLRAVFGDDPVNSILGELDKQGQMRATNNLALGGSKTAMATAADQLIPTAKEAGTLGHGTGALSMLAGGELGGHLGSMVGHPEVGALLGGAAGTIWNRGVAPMINASRQAAQTASRSSMAKALTAEPSDTLAKALASRQRLNAMPAKVSDKAAALARSVGRIGVAAGHGQFQLSN